MASLPINYYDPDKGNYNPYPANAKPTTTTSTKTSTNTGSTSGSFLGNLAGSFLNSSPMATGLLSAGNAIAKLIGNAAAKPATTAPAFPTFNNSADAFEYKRKSPERIEKQALTMTNLAINPQIQALADALAQAKTNLANKQNTINASYAGLQAQTDRAMNKAQEDALKSAVARGMARSGVVEALTDKLTAPVLENMQAAEKQRIAEVQNVLDSISSLEYQNATQRQALEAQRGNMLASLIEQLSAQEDANELGAYNASSNARAIMADANAAMQNAYTNFAATYWPYLGPTWKEENDNLAAFTTAYGGSPASVTQEQLMPLRNYATNIGRGSDIGYTEDETGKYIKIGSMTIPVGSLGTYGGKIDNGTTFLPRSIIDNLLGIG